MAGDRLPAERWYGWLLQCYPLEFRARFEPGMRDAFARDHDAAKRRGYAALASFWFITIFEAVAFGLDERRPRRRTPMWTWLVDVRDAWRSLRATPVIAAVAVLSLALGTGANTALFSIMNSMLYKALPVRDPGQLVLLDSGSWTNPIWEQIRDRDVQFSDGAFAWSSVRFDLAEQGQTDFVPGAYVSGRMFEILGVQAALGRTIAPGDDVPGMGPSGPVAVLGYDLWQRRFGGAHDVLGKTLSVARVKFTIVGVAERGFFGPDVGTNAAVFIPIAANEAIRGSRDQLEGRSTWWLEIIARLRPGQTAEQAATILNASRHQVKQATAPPRYRDSDLQQYLKEPWKFIPAATGVSDLRARYRDPLKVLLVIVGVVLVIACANIANVLIARSTARRHELSLRLALGATRWRLMKQLLLESLMIAVAGAALGLVFSQWASALVVKQISSATYLDLTPDLRVLLFTAGVAIATAVLFGVAPSLGVVSVAPNEVLKERGRGVGGDGRFGVRQTLVVVQVALSLALVIGAGLFVRTFSSLTARSFGFDADPVLVSSLNAQKSAVPVAGRPLMFEQLRRAAESIPGVESASLSFTTPMGNAGWNTVIAMPDQPSLTERERLSNINIVTPQWFQTYGMRLVAGRNFGAGDTVSSPKVAIVTRTFAKKFMPGADPIGRQVVEEDGRQKVSYEVVGIVEDSAYRSARENLGPIMYRPLSQTDDGGLSTSIELSVRAKNGATDPLVRPLSAALTAVEPNLAMTTAPFSRNIERATRQERLVAMMSGFFGGLALLLAAIGLYGVTSYSVQRRRSEIGIRLALGARPDRIVRMVLARAGWLVTIGVVAGALMSIWIVRYVSTLLYGVQPRDPMTLAIAVAALGIVALIAAWLPARRASRIDPTVTLRAE